MKWNLRKFVMIFLDYAKVFCAVGVVVLAAQSFLYWGTRHYSLFIQALIWIASLLLWFKAFGYFKKMIPLAERNAQFRQLSGKAARLLIINFPLQIVLSLFFIFDTPKEPVPLGPFQSKNMTAVQELENLTDMFLVFLKLFSPFPYGVLTLIFAFWLLSISESSGEVPPLS